MRPTSWEPSPLGADHTDESWLAVLSLHGDLDDAEWAEANRDEPPAQRTDPVRATDTAAA